MRWLREEVASTRAHWAGRGAPRGGGHLRAQAGVRGDAGIGGRRRRAVFQALAGDKRR